MRIIRGLPGCLAVGAVFLLAACGAGTQSTALSPAARRALVEAMGARDTAAGDGDSRTLDALRQAALGAPRDPGVQQRYALAAEQAERYPEALDAIDRAVAAGGATPERLLIQGRIALEAGNAVGAGRAFGQALSGDPGNVDALDGLAVSEDLQRDHVRAQEHYASALRLAPGDWRVRTNLAMSLLMSGRAADAAGTLAGADQDSAAPRRARQDLALALVAAGRREQAIRILSAEMAPADAAALADRFARFAAWLESPDGRPMPADDAAF